MNIRQNIINYFFSKDIYKKLDQEKLESFNYLENNFFTSIAFMEMIAAIEETFSIELLEEDIKNEEFATVGGLIKIIEKRINKTII